MASPALKRRMCELTCRAAAAPDSGPSPDGLSVVGRVRPVGSGVRLEGLYLSDVARDAVEALLVQRVRI
jgi:hypothetical protein